jgi:hypothetical protein
LVNIFQALLNHHHQLVLHMLLNQQTLENVSLNFIWLKAVMIDEVQKKKIDSSLLKMVVGS